MRDALSVLVPFFVALILLAIFIALVQFCWSDAKKRGKSPVLVTVLVLCFFPVGLVAWLLFRPEPPPHELLSSHASRASSPPWQ
jgi:drug/metabolite transporter (DMT)-like permease